MRFLGHHNVLKYVFYRGSAPDPAGRAQRSSELIAALREPACKGRERRGKRKWQKKKARGKEAWREGRRMENYFLAGSSNLKLCHCLGSRDWEINPEIAVTSWCINVLRMQSNDIGTMRACVSTPMLLILQGGAKQVKLYKFFFQIFILCTSDLHMRV